jgi:hypothetical protein
MADFASHLAEMAASIEEHLGSATVTVRYVTRGTYAAATGLHERAVQETSASAVVDDARMSMDGGVPVVTRRFGIRLASLPHGAPAKGDQIVSGGVTRTVHRVDLEAGGAIAGVHCADAPARR